LILIYISKQLQQHTAQQLLHFQHQHHCSIITLSTLSPNKQQSIHDNLLIHFINHFLAELGLVKYT